MEYIGRHSSDWLYWQIIVHTQAHWLFHSEFMSFSKIESAQDDENMNMPSPSKKYICQF